MKKEKPIFELDIEIKALPMLEEWKEFDKEIARRLREISKFCASRSAFALTNYFEDFAKKFEVPITTPTFKALTGINADDASSSS